MQEKKKVLSEQNEAKKEKLLKMKEDIKKWKVEQNPIVKQLREHFKALKDEMNEMMEDDESEDEIDIDNMTYEVPPG